MYIKSRKVSYTALLATLLLWGCESEPVGGPETGNEEQPLVIENVNINEYSTANTRALAFPTSKLTGGAIGISLKKPNGTEYINCKYIYQAGQSGGEGLAIPECFKPADPQNTIYTNSTENCYGYAYYPYQENVPEITIPYGSVCEYSPELDICRSPIVTDTDGIIQNMLLLQRIWARLQITLQTGANYPGTCKVTAVSVSSAHSQYKVTLNNMAPPYIAGKDVLEAVNHHIYYYYPGSSITAQSMNSLSYFYKEELNKTVGTTVTEIINLLIPPIQYYGEKRDISIIKAIGMEIDGSWYYISKENTGMWGSAEEFEKILIAVNNLEPGQYKRLAITINPEALSFSNVTLQAWEDVPLSPDGGDGNFYPQ